MTSPITAQARAYVRARATMAMEYTCRIERGPVPGAYDEDSLIYTSPQLGDLVYEGPCRIWEVSAPTSVVVGDTDIHQQSTQLSIPWDSSERVERYDQVTLLTAPQDSQMVNKRYEIQSIDRAGDLRATRTFQVTGVDQITGSDR